MALRDETTFKKIAEFTIPLMMIPLKSFGIILIPSKTYQLDVNSINLNSSQRSPLAPFQRSLIKLFLTDLLLEPGSNRIANYKKHNFNCSEFLLLHSVIKIVASINKHLIMTSLKQAQIPKQHLKLQYLQHEAASISTHRFFLDGAVFINSI